jgi:hypothetical protein
LLAGPLAAKSQAGVYTASDCASWNTHSEAQYAEIGHHMVVVSYDCGGGGNGLFMALPQAYASGYGSFARFTVTAPAGTHFIAVSGAQRGVNADGWVVEVRGCSPSACGPNVYVSGDGYWRLFGLPQGYYSNWWEQLICATSTCNGSTQAGTGVRDVTMTMSDDVAPTVSQSGELMSGEIQRGTGWLQVAPADVGAGLTSAWVVVNDQEVARRNYGCSGVPMQPCALNGPPARFDLDTQSAPFHDGENAVQACTADYGTPANVACTARQVIKVDNSCEGSSVPGGADLTARFSRNDDGAITVRSHKSATVAGRLSDQSGDPVAGATLCVKEMTLAPGEALEGVGTVKTKSNGRYRYTVAPGPSRDVQVGYRYRRRQLQRDLRYYAKAVPSLKLSRSKVRNGHRIRLAGSVPGPRNDERIVVLQARYPGKNQKWKTFQKARTDQFGRYSALYRFLATFATTEYRMRAVVPAQNGYPFLTGHSRPRPIKVIGS